MARGEFDRLHEQLEELFDDLWQVPGLAGLRRGYRPRVDCYRSDQPPAITVVVDLAGVDPEEVELAVVERVLVVSGRRRRRPAECPVSYQQMEIEYGPFLRRIALGDDVDAAAAVATYDRGFLIVVLPLAPRPRTGKVAIALGGKE